MLLHQQCDPQHSTPVSAVPGFTNGAGIQPEGEVTRHKDTGAGAVQPKLPWGSDTASGRTAEVDPALQRRGQEHSSGF